MSDSFATPWTVAFQAPPSIGFSRQEYWSGVPLPSPPGGSAVKNPPAPANAGEPGLISGSGRSPGEGNGYSLQYSCLEDPIGRGTWRAISSWGHKESGMTE